MAFKNKNLIMIKLMKSIFLHLFFGVTVLSTYSCSSGATPIDNSKHELIKNNLNENLDVDNLKNTDSISSIKNKLTGKFDYTKDSDFVLVNSIYCTRPSYMQKEAYLKFVEMCKLAEKSGISLKIISGTRNFKEQTGIWNRKWEKYIVKKDSIETMKTILTYSSMPSTSRHHWGTDVDINSLENSYFESGKGLKEYNWLCENASKFGFCQVYTSKKNSKRTGYEMEKWHWSYLPVATKNLENFNKLITYSDIKGFKGSNLASKIKSIENYVNGIDNKCTNH
jgi:LAS superfamily LD-carboxypeptidase LdcB